MSKRWEQVYPVIISVTLTITLCSLGFTPTINGFEKVLDGTITFVSIVIGFLAALLAIILSISKSKVMKHLYEYVDAEKGKNILFHFFQQSLIAGFLSVILSIWMYIIKNQNPLQFYGKAVFFIWLVFALFFILAAYRIINLLMAALFKEAKPEKKTNQTNTLSNELIEEFKRDSTRKPLN